MTSRPRIVPAVPPESDELFIGYAPPMPPRVARVIRRTVVVLGAGALAAAGALAIGHVPLAGGTFEFGRPRPVRGTIVESPYPALVPDAGTAGSPRATLLVAPGKHGATSLVRGLDGAHVSLEGVRAARGAHEMLEIVPGSLARIGGSAVARAPWSPPDGLAGTVPVTLRGEIVDTKCFLGVMVPGQGKTHRTCAALCLRGGIPPALVTVDRRGNEALVLLVAPDGGSLAPLIHRFIGEPVEVVGRLGRERGWLTLATDPATWR